MRIWPGRRLLQALLQRTLPYIQSKAKGGMRSGQGHHSGKEFPALGGRWFRLLYSCDGAGRQRIEVGSSSRKEAKGS